MTRLPRARPASPGFFGVPFVVPLVLSFVVLGGCTASDLIRVATSPADLVDRTVLARARAYVVDPTRIVRDIGQLRGALKSLVLALRGRVGPIWGEDEAAVPGKRRYVKYTGKYRSRAIVDFDAGVVTVETLERKQPRRSLESAIVAALLTPDDPRSVDLYTDAEVELGGRPYLHGVVVDHRGAPIETESQARAFARHLMEGGVRTRKTRDGKPVRYVEMRMVDDHRAASARHYAPLVRESAARYEVSESLVYAVMETESSFNPFAVSPAPAYGLMQLIPTAGGRDAYREVFGRDGTPTRDDLFHAGTNIELGTAYLHILERRYLKGIEHPLAREYCVIASYNGGAGYVLRSFHADRDRALARINSMAPAAVYRHLTEKLTRDETRRYVKKVLSARSRYAGMSRG